jgi:hypothetical protein
MAEGLLTSILQLIRTFTTAVTQNKDQHNPPEESQHLFTEILALQSLISEFQDIYQILPNGGPGHDKLLNALSQLEDMIKHCNSKVEENRLLNHPIPGTLWKEQEAKNNLESIEHFRTSLYSWLNQYGSALVHHIIVMLIILLFSQGYPHSISCYACFRWTTQQCLARSISQWPSQHCPAAPGTLG